MKKATLFIIAFCLSISIFSQIKFGVKAGGNVSKLTGLDYGGTTSGGTGFAPGFHAGAFVNYSFNHKYGIQPEFIFSMQGGKEPEIKSFDVKGGIVRFNYINIPILFNIKSSNSSFNYLLGPQFGYCVSRSFVDGILIYKKENYRDFDFAIAVGIQKKLSKNFALELRFNYGLTQSFKRGYIDDIDDTLIYKGVLKGQRNLVLQLSASWAF